MQSHNFNHPEQWKTEQHVKYRQADTEWQNNIILKGKLYCKKLSNADKEKRYYAVMQATIFIGSKNTKVWWASRNSSQFSVQHNKSCLKKRLFSRLESWCSYQPEFLPASLPVTVHWKCKRSFSYEPANLRQEAPRENDQPADFLSSKVLLHLYSQFSCFFSRSP